MNEGLKYGDIGWESYIVEIEYPYSWRHGYTYTPATLDELNEYVEKTKARSTPQGTEGYISIRVGVVTRVN